MTTPTYTCRQFRLLIAGSRDASPDMLRTATQAVARAKANGWLVLVGDNPRGVDAAVIDACDKMGVNVMVFGVSAQPRKGSRREGSFWRVDTKYEAEDGYVPGQAYTERDHYMIALADRCFFIHDGFSRGTKAGYEYAIRAGKPADLRVFAPEKPPKPPAPSVCPAKPASAALHTVELIVDVSEQSDSHTFEGVFGLRALDAQGKLLYDAQQTIQADVNSLDGARLQTILVVLERLTARLKTDQAPHRLRVFQSSKNVEGWCAKSWRRNVPEVQRLTAKIDALLQRFPDVEWVKMPRAQVASKLSKIGKGGVGQRR
jgi:hypothetical protein